jgi:glutaconate CoA-transferase subunit A
VGSLHAIRRVSEGPAATLELEEYSHYGMVGRYIAGATKLPFYPLRSYYETDMPTVNPRIRSLRSPYGGDEVYVVPPLNPDVTVIHAQRADAAGNTQIWGLLGAQKEAAFAADRVIVVVEELVEEAVIRADPNRTLIPGLIVDAVVVEPYGAHPSYTQGYYDRDNAFYVDWDAIGRDPERTAAWLSEWVHGLSGRAEYMERLGPAAAQRIQPSGPAPAGPIDYGAYR